MAVPVSCLQARPQQFIAATSLSFDQIQQFSLHRMPVQGIRQSPVVSGEIARFFW
jgi:hypothetical protein